MRPSLGNKVNTLYLTEMELYTIMIDYHLQRGDSEKSKSIGKGFVEIAEEQRNGVFLFRKKSYLFAYKV